jgi:uroporphyrinogen decarboxylase
MAKTSQNHRDRVQTCLAGGKPDRIPVSLWRHFPVDDQTPHGLAAATAAFQLTYDFDFVKVTPSSSFCLKDWGAVDQWKGSTEGTREYTSKVVHHPEGWAALSRLDPTSGALGQQLECLRLLVNEFSKDTPVVQTIFSPLAQAKNLVGKDQLLVHMRQHPDLLKSGLKTIAETTIMFIEEAARTGIDGIFYAVQHAQFEILSAQEFEEFQKHFDLMVLEAAKNLWFRMGHLHGENVMFDEVAEYPFNALNWHDQHTPPSLGEAQKKYNGVVCGGLKRWETMVLGTPEDVQSEAWTAAEMTGGHKFILGTGCVLPIVAPYGNILAASRSFSGNWQGGLD